MTTKNSESEEPSSTDSPQRKLITKEDSRLFAVTALATIAANLVTVMLIGIALALAHGNRDSLGSRIGFTALGIVFILLGYLRRGEPKFRLHQRQGAWFFIGTGVFLIILNALIWIGQAAGIKL